MALRIVLVAAANRQPAWVVEGYENYARRLGGRWRLELKELALARRSPRGGAERAREAEGAKMLATLPRAARVVALDERGDAWSTSMLAERLERWAGLGEPVFLLLGGPDGLAPACLERASERWSLSALTLPHGLVRVVVAEALYRASTLLEGHPYHRA